MASEFTRGGMLNARTEFHCVLELDLASLAKTNLSRHDLLRWVSNVSQTERQGKKRAVEKQSRMMDDLLCDGCVLPALALPTARLQLLAIVRYFVRL